MYLAGEGVHTRSNACGQRTMDNKEICALAASEQKFVSKVEKEFRESIYQFHLIILSFDCFIVLH